MKKHIRYFSQSFLKGHLNKLLQVLINLISDPIPKAVVLKCLTKRTRVWLRIKYRFRSSIAIR